MRLINIPFLMFPAIVSLILLGILIAPSAIADHSAAHCKTESACPFEWAENWADITADEPSLIIKSFEVIAPASPPPTKHLVEIFSPNPPPTITFEVVSSTSTIDNSPPPIIEIFPDPPADEPRQELIEISLTPPPPPTASIGPPPTNIIITVEEEAIEFLPPTAGNDVSLSDLDFFADPVILSPADARAGGGGDSKNSKRQVLNITGRRYDDASNLPQVFTQQLEFAALGIWVNGDAAALDNFAYANLNDNAVAPPTPAANIGKATYDIEGDVIYKGARLYPDGSIEMNFNDGAFNGEVIINGSRSKGPRVDDFGGFSAKVPNGRGGLRAIASNDNFAAAWSGAITADGFSGSGRITDSGGFFSDFELNAVSENAVNGRFHSDLSIYDGAIPPNELSALFSISDKNGAEMKGGFLGKVQ